MSRGPAPVRSIHTGETFLRVQCKTGRLRKGCITFSTRSIRANHTGVFFRDYRGEIDLYGVNWASLDRLYAVPVEVAPQGSCALRVDRAANNQERNIRWAADFEVPA